MMKFLLSIWEEAIGLFVDDGALAALCVGLIAILTVAVLVVGLPGLVAGLLLLLGCVLILAWSIWRAVRA